MPPECRVGSGDIIEAHDLARLTAQDCIIEPGAILRLHYRDAPTADPAPSHTVKPPRKVIKMPPTEASGADAPHNPDDSPAEAAHTLTAQTAADPAPIDVSALSQIAGGGGITVALALIAVLFGAAGWRFWTRISDQHHELKLKQIELAAASNGERSPQHCQAAHAQLESRIAALEGKVTAVEQSAPSFDASFDPADLKRRLTKLEKALKPARKP